MVVFTPKSMLKRKEAASLPADFTEGTFRPFVVDADADPATVDTLLICSGRITWDLMVERAKREDAGRFAIARVEQLYPAPIDEMKAELARLPGLTSVRWVQDEPGNMGPAPYYSLNVWPELELPVQLITRPRSSSPSVGTAKRHVEEQKALVAEAFDTESDRTTQNY
jgi:2-oxoglutarate dehydrogenase E1 component